MAGGGDVVRAAAPGRGASAGCDVVSLTSAAPLLRSPAGSVGTQGRAAAGMAGVRLSPRATVTWFGAIGTGPGPARSGEGPAMEPVVVTVAGSTGALPG